ncbi:hypothetical protein PVAND_011179 [Polypedilum vanderplanki]|uniref:Uncharacterized protein n=1 Tax=Polypedilum vanderplanki TaxID=319348 RepID=A0A9J6CJ63_POLVA|nr:hypothetical protein PVAND_011179 [Polypedilum vanderplanki]
MSDIFRHTKKNVLKLFRKLSLSNLKSTESGGGGSSNINGGEYKAKYQPQKNHSITISPSSSNEINRKRLNHNKKRDSSRHKSNSSIHDIDDEDDFTVHKSNSSIHDIDDEDDFTVPDRRRRSYLKSCIKKRLNNNYEKQINCIQDENVVFTDNKIYISLSARNSSLEANNSLKKNRRVIYPSMSGPCKITGFLRHYDFSYDDENESPARSAKAVATATRNDEKLKFNMMREQSSPAFLESVVFEKVKKIKTTSSSSSSSCNFNELISSSYVHVSNNDDERNEGDSILTSSTFITSYEADDEDDVQWRNFLELRKQHGKVINNNASQLNDSGFGSQLFFSTSSSHQQQQQYQNNNSKTLDIWQDDETFDNSFNEELEQRVSVMFPEFYKSSSQSAHFNNINNINHLTADKLS